VVLQGKGPKKKRGFLVTSTNAVSAMQKKEKEKRGPRFSEGKKKGEEENREAGTSSTSDRGDTIFLPSRGTPASMLPSRGTTFHYNRGKRRKNKANSAKISEVRLLEGRDHFTSPGKNLFFI